ncbi:helix-turn-helix domain-containing protein [Enterococcus faecalis]|uniref:helix-turn-helix domain-containing protein n=1 Tax=Enterococcus faecalis TaxID=1351 RepID=UPI001CF52F89|nr:helix-turn-helix transcriptional regulator [Enterococcus faecalis]MCA6777732.1 helix-turn-helix domain-containing protein [Enterococcus faecalis]HCT6711164.1 helix-turn-helix transcriptional regulator [Enterococcus faecalis]HCT6950305.1 helix-turn-helix transcriptional regulator [Enterococcus faecalis]HCT6953177.1 helix-turn-helix transcriptional regulator [Enterococcus faecalis]HCT6961327.1 helix-turn-helix transcriptional regulator [Enterococcus faecalis]
MTTFERIKKLAKQKDKSLQQVARELKYGENYFYSLNAGKQPTAEKLQEIADYFNVSVDYLLGRTDDTKATDEKKSADLDDVLDNVMSFDGEPLDDHDREVIRAYLKGRFGK